VGTALRRPVLASASSVRHKYELTKSNIDYGSRSYDHSFDDYQRSQYEGDPTGRTSHYMLVGGARVLYASLARLTVVKMVATMSASADVLALGTLEVNIGDIEMGKAATLKFRGKPVFIRHRTDDEVQRTIADDEQIGSMRDPAIDSDRTLHPEQRFIVLEGVCTHLGCVPISGAGDFKASGGWFCPCHGSHYDGSGRVRKGPAPLNLPVPTYRFVEGSDYKVIVLGESA